MKRRIEKKVAQDAKIKRMHTHKICAFYSTQYLNSIFSSEIIFCAFFKEEDLVRAFFKHVSSNDFNKRSGG
jgi:hypothetical protein